MTLLQGFALDQRRRGLAEGTIESRRVQLVAFARWLAPRQLLEADAHDVNLFLDGREPMAPRTRYVYLSNLHAFYTWAMREGLTTDDPTTRIARPRVRPGLPRPISEADLGVAIGCADPTMRAWLVLGAFAGLRCAEIAGLTRDAVLDVHGLLRVLGKGRRERLVPIHPCVAHALAVVGLPHSGPIFTRNGQPYTPQQVSRQIATYLRGLGIDATAHQLRHRFATQTYDRCHDLRVVQELLGHASPTTTAIYTGFSHESAREAVLALDEVA